MTAPVPFLRAFLYWLAAYVPLYVISFFLFEGLLQTGEPLLLWILQLSAPLVYGLAAWLFFRRQPEMRWEWRGAIAVAWVLLGIAVNAALILPVYGYDWTAAVNARVFQGQAINVLVILAVSHVAVRHPARGKRPKITAEEAADILEGPKF